MPLSFLILAAAAVVVATAVVIAVVGVVAVVAAAAEQNQQNDNPAHIATAKAIVTHRKYLRKIEFTALPFIPRYSLSPIMCKGLRKNNPFLTAPTSSIIDPLISVPSL